MSELTAARIAELARSARLVIDDDEAARFAAPLTDLLLELEATARRFEADDVPAEPIPIFAPDPATSYGAFIHRFERLPIGPGSLDGLAVGIKDTIALRGVPRTRGRKDGWDLPVKDATVVARILAAGGRIVGTLNLDAWSASATGEGSEFGIIENPRAANHLAGGSSAGAGAALAAGLVDLAIGTDTAGSARIPASWCGVYALKPSHGAIPSDGVIGLDPSLDDVCPMARTLADCRALFAVLAGSPADSTPSARRAGIIRGIKQDYDADGAAAVGEAVSRLTAAGWAVSEVDIPLWRSAWLIESMLLTTSVPYLARTGWQGRWFPGAEMPMPWDPRPPQLVTLWILAVEALGDRANDYYRAAQRHRQLLSEQVRIVFNSVDLILTPTTPTVAPRRAPVKEGSLLATASGAATAVTTSTLTTPANLTGIPALALPIGETAEGLPRSVQIHAPFGREAWLFEAAIHVAG